jgi:nucleoside-diphosphate-sugar epimerase
MKTALVCGAGGFIGSHMVRRLKKEGYWVRGVDLKYPEFSETEADEFIIGDLTDDALALNVCNRSFDEIYQFAADMGGAGYLFTGENDANIMHNSVQINLNVLRAASITSIDTTKIFYSSSACVYSELNQEDVNHIDTSEASVYPAQPDSEYGWEKLFSERLFFAFARQYDLDVKVARYHNVFGPEGTWTGGKEKVPAAMCRKVAEVPEVGGHVQVWGNGEQTRSFLFIDECIEATYRLMQSDWSGPVNIGSEEMVSINDLVDIVSNVAGKPVRRVHKIDANCIGVKARNSNNNLIRKMLEWDYTMSLKEGIEITYDWIRTQVEESNKCS